MLLPTYPFILIYRQHYFSLNSVECTLDPTHLITYLVVLFHNLVNTFALLLDNPVDQPHSVDLMLCSRIDLFVQSDDVKGELLTNGSNITDHILTQIPAEALHMILECI